MTGSQPCSRVQRAMLQTPPPAVSARHRYWLVRFLDVSRTLTTALSAAIPKGRPRVMLVATWPLAVLTSAVKLILEERVMRHAEIGRNWFCGPRSRRKIAGASTAMEDSPIS